MQSEKVKQKETKALIVSIVVVELSAGTLSVLLLLLLPPI